MADIKNVREFNLMVSLGKGEPGKTYVVVNGSKKKIIGCFKAEVVPNQIEKTITKIYYR